jgi:UDPglucose 6-dehydrogenase
MKKIAVVGIGYVGLVTGTCLAELGNQVIGVDIDKKKIENLKKGVIPIYEKGLTELVKENSKDGRLTFTTDIKKAIRDSEVIFIAVGTPPLASGGVNLEYVKKVAESIGKNMNGYKVIVNKSTVPIGTGESVEKIIKNFYKGDFDVVSNPEFLREGSAVYDFMNPDRIVIGNGSAKAEEVIRDIYKGIKDTEMVLTDIKTAELIKYTSNALLATEISFINSIANICEKIGADVEDVANGMMLDKRIGKKAFLHAGVGYGGSCFPKDVKGLIQIAREKGVPFSILEATEDTNDAQKRSLLLKVQKLLGDDLGNKQVTIWGLAFKPHTDDIREAPSLVIIKQLLDRGVKVKVFDPIAKEAARKILGDSVIYEDNLMSSVKDSNCLVVATEWPEFKTIDLKQLRSLMRSPNVVDGRNVFDLKEMKKEGFDYLPVGR